MPETVEEVEVAAKPEKIAQNGITRPKTGSTTGRIFDISDELSAAAGTPAARKDVLAQCESEGINKATAATQYGRWRLFNGLKKEVKKPVAAEEAAVEEVVEDAAE